MPAPRLPALQEPVYKLLPIWFVLLPRQSTKRVCPSVWPVVHGHVGSPEAMGGQAASWLEQEAWGPAPSLLLGTMGRVFTFCDQFPLPSSSIADT